MARPEDFEMVQNDELIMRLGFGLTIFLPKPFNAIHPTLGELWRKYVATVGEKTFSWARLGGGNRSRKAAPAVFRTIEAWLSGEKDYGGDCWISIHDGPFDCIGQNSFKLEGLDRGGEDVGSLEIEFPFSVIESKGPDDLFDLIANLVDGVPFLTGMAGYSFHHSPYKLRRVVGRMEELSRRFEGVEVIANERMCYWAGKGLTTVNWITLIGNGYVDRLGGRERLVKQLPAECVVRGLNHGLAIRAGDRPLLGDKNKGTDELELWRRVYRTVRSAQFVDPMYEFDRDEFNGQQTSTWLQRLG
jgi:hypothetical protein